MSNEIEIEKKPRRPPLYTVEKLEKPVLDPATASVDDLAAAAVPTITRFTPADLSDDQLAIYNQIINWYEKHTDEHPYLTLGGLAGTGKSTLVSVLAGALQEREATIAFVAYTGKAVRVLGRKLTSQGIRPDFCGTLHSFLYAPIVHDHVHGGRDCPAAQPGYKGPGCGKRGTIESWQLRDDIDNYDLIILDEASMVGEELWHDLCAARVPILAVGDHGQLPPIGKGALNLMESPHLRLEKIHRQAEGNPILALAHHIRQGGNLRAFRPADDRVQFIRTFPQVAHVAASFDNAAICYFNKTRVQLNAIVRAHAGRAGPVPDPEDVVVCLKNNGRVLANGMRGIFEEIVSPDTDELARFKASCRFPDDNIRIKGLFQYHQFGRDKTIAAFDDLPNSENYHTWHDVGLLFDFGYSLTCHKMQGSQAKEVVLRYETFWKDTDDTRRRWGYTAVTRASERLYLVL
jgi:exodeoxyribonuclease-5